MMMFKIVFRKDPPMGMDAGNVDAYIFDWCVVDADGERVYPSRAVPWDDFSAPARTKVLAEAYAILNRSPLSYHMLLLDGLSPIEAAKHILERVKE